MESKDILVELKKAIDSIPRDYLFVNSKTKDKFNEEQLKEINSRFIEIKVCELVEDDKMIFVPNCALNTFNKEKIGIYTDANVSHLQNFYSSKYGLFYNVRIVPTEIKVKVE